MCCTMYNFFAIIRCDFHNIDSKFLECRVCNYVFKFPNMQFTTNR